MTTTAGIDEFLDVLGTRDRVVREMSGLKEDFEFADSIVAALAAEHQGEWLAVYRREIVALEGDLEKVGDKLAAAGVPTWRAVVRRVQQPPEGTIHDHPWQS